MLGLKAVYEAEKAKLLARAQTATMPGFGDVRRLPAPVQDYLGLARTKGIPGARGAILVQRGELRAAPGKPWMPFTAEQVYCMDPPGFVWLARARIARIVHMSAMDSFLGGRGNMRIRLLDLVTIADAKGPELDQGAALRYWGEILAFPSAVVSPQLHWEAIDARRARLVAHGPGPEVSAVVEFDKEGFPASTHASRYRDVGGKTILTPWSGFMKDWNEVNGFVFPSTWESAWHLDDGDFLAVRMAILGVTIL